MSNALRIPVLAFLAFVLCINVQAQDARTIMNNMLSAIDNVKTLKIHLKRTERFGSKFVKGELDAKIQERPRKVYLINQYPDEGVEVLWVSGERGGKARINPNSFVLPNMDLWPHGSLMMKKQHHSVHELGFGMIARIIRDALKKYGEKFNSAVTYDGTTTVLGKNCHKIEINSPDWELKDYTVKKGENLFSIAKKLVISEYLIMENNDDVDGFYDVDEGQVIKVPNVFSKYAILYIDTQTNLPIVQEVHDENGMFEKYEYSKLQINPFISSEEFTEDYEGYDY